MLQRADFWKEESEAPILRLNYSFLSSTGVLTFTDEENDENITKTFDHERIIRLDAERTFLGAAQRTTLMNVLSFLRNEFGSYHQAMSYVAGFLLLNRTPTKVIEIMRKLHRNVLVGYWTEEPVAFAVDAYVFDYFLENHEPEIHERLSKFYILPETYAQKWFTTLCVGVLPFEALFLFFDTYVIPSLDDSSNTFLFQFALSLMKHMREKILNAKNVASIYGYLRLDQSLIPFNTETNDLILSIVRCAKDYDLSQYDIVMLREKAFNEKLRARLEAANRAHQQNKEDLASNGTSSDDDENEEETSLTTMKKLVSDMKQLRIG